MSIKNKFKSINVVCMHVQSLAAGIEGGAVEACLYFVVQDWKWRRWILPKYA